MGRIIEYTKMALKSIGANKGRSALTMLGIIIGIGSVIMILAVGAGGQAMMNEQFSSIGAGTIIVGINWEDMTDTDLMTMDDIEAIDGKIPYLKAVSPTLSNEGAVYTDKKSLKANVQGNMPGAFLIQDIEMARGRTYSQSDYDNARNVVMIDQVSARELFGTDDVVGMKLDVQVGGRTGTFTIVGIIKVTGMSYNTSVTANLYIPLSTQIKLTGETDTVFYQLMACADSSDRAQQVGASIIRLLEARHNNKDRNVYTLEDMSQFIDQIKTVQNMFINIIAAVAAISLLVGGIGVMNIMLVSVTERTREIGIRKALGAKTGSILFQFLVESAVITMIGGIIGVALGVLGGQAIGSAMGISAMADPIMLLMVVVFSSGVGLFFGIYPARKAAKLHPIEALRSE